jgi:hypothetical protein
VTHVWRRLGRFPLFTSVAVLTLAIGIGANAAIFAVVYGVLLKPLPYPHADELFAVDHSAPGVNLKSAGSAPFLYFTYREQSKSFADVGLWQGDTATVTGLAEPEEIRVVDVSDGVLPILGAKPAAGRLFTRADDTPGSPETVILILSRSGRSRPNRRSARVRPATETASGADRDRTRKGAVDRRSDSAARRGGP